MIAGNLFGLTVAVEDASHNVVSSFNGIVTIALANNSGGAYLNGTLSVIAVNGMATFTGLSLATAGSYTIIASSGVLAVATTVGLNVTSTAFPRLAIFAQSTDVIAASYFQLTVDVETAQGVPNLDVYTVRVMPRSPATSTGATLGVVTCRCPYGMAKLRSTA